MLASPRGRKINNVSRFHGGVSPSAGLLSSNNNSTRYAANIQTAQTPDSVITPVDVHESQTKAASVLGNSSPKPSARLLTTAAARRPPAFAGRANDRHPPLPAPVPKAASRNGGSTASVRMRASGAKRQVERHSRAHKCQSAERLQCVNNRRQRPVRKHDFDLCGQPIAAVGCGFDCCNAVFQHDVVGRLLEPQPGQPAPMHQRPGGTIIMAAMAQKKA